MTIITMSPRRQPSGSIAISGPASGEPSAITGWTITKRRPSKLACLVVA